LPTEKNKAKRTFETFRNGFLRLISSPHFGEPREYQPTNADSTSPAYRELQNTGLLSSLRSADFIRGLYQAIKKHARLEAEKPKVRQVARTARPIINDFRYAQKRLERIKHDLEELNLKYPKLWVPQLNEHIHTAIGHVEAFKCLLADREKLWISGIHSKLRKPEDVPSKWDPLLKGYEYELDSLHIRAADQWLWREVNHRLSLVSATDGRRLSKTTRFKLIAGICKAADIGPFEPTTIKESLRKTTTK
jgi:hypothetical protein